MADRIKLMVNMMGEVVLISTSLTVLRVESDESSSDIESMHLSQKQKDFPPETSIYPPNQENLSDSEPNKLQPYILYQEG